jgi:hypothetical protein
MPISKQMDFTGKHDAKGAVSRVLAAVVQPYVLAAGSVVAFNCAARALSGHGLEATAFWALNALAMLSGALEHAPEKLRFGEMANASWKKLRIEKKPPATFYLSEQRRIKEKAEAIFGTKKKRTGRLFILSAITVTGTILGGVLSGEAASVASWIGGSASAFVPSLAVCTIRRNRRDMLISGKWSLVEKKDL